MTWERGLREAGNRLPVVAGIPGVTSPPALLKFALACGIGPSVEVLRKQSGGLLKLATTRLWRPDQLAEGIARSTIDDPGSLIAGPAPVPVRRGRAVGPVAGGAAHRSRGVGMRSERTLNADHH